MPGLDPDLDHFRQFSKAQCGWRLSSVHKPRATYENWRYGIFPVAVLTGIGPLIGESIQALITGHYMRHLPLKLVNGELLLTILHLGLCIYTGIVLPYYLVGSAWHVLLPYAVHGLLYYGFSSVSHSNEGSQSEIWSSGKEILAGERYLTGTEPEKQPSSAGRGILPAVAKRKEWAAHQIETSYGDYAPTSITWGLLALGLNNQALHHVFPGIHPCHYYKLTPVLRRVCDKHGVNYHTHSNFFQAFSSHLGFVAKLNDKQRQEPAATNNAQPTVLPKA